MNTDPIIRRKLADEVRDRLITLIRTQEMSPGDRLPSERELMERFGVGRPAVREALQSLGAAGWIEINHGERARIAAPSTHRMFERLGEAALHLLQTSPKALSDLKEARIQFEVGMVKTAARQATAADIAKLEETVQRQRASLDHMAQFVQFDMAFHAAIAAVSGNSICTLLSEAMLDWLFQFRRDLLRLPGSEHITLAEHERLLAAIRAHDTAEAERAMLEHLTRANERYRILEEAARARATELENHTG
jgi:DNA-binding FadR family transcriptional regulator